MDSVLNVKISCFKNYRSADSPRPINMLTWLTSGKYKKQVQQLRGIKNKAKRDEIKAKLPAITPSGTFGKRSKIALIWHSGLLQFDVDFKENTHIKNYNTLKQQIANINNVAYCGLSVSGTGFWGLVPVKYPQKHNRHFRALEKAFKDFGIIIDSSCSDVSRLRGYSYDPGGYFNHTAEVFTRLAKKPKPQPQTFKASQSGDDTRDKVEQLISKIDTDITAGYDNWLRLGFAIESEFGESGRKYFHAISSYHPHYNQHECDHQYTHCLKHRGSGIGIGTFFHICNRHGITLKNNLNASTAKYESGKNGNSSKISNNPDNERFTDTGLSIEKFNKRYESYPNPPF